MSNTTTYRDKTVPWSVAVVDVEGYDGAFVRVTCEMPSNTPLATGDTIAVDVAPTTQTFRRYTVSRITDATFEFIGFRTARGPATEYLDQLSAGDALNGQGPERPVKLPTADMAHVVVMGDETVIGTAVAVSGATPNPVAVAVKTTHGVEQVSQFLQPSVLSVCVDEEAMKSWLTNFLTNTGVESVGVFLVGEQSANQALRQHAFSLGVGKERLATRTFWRPDKVGLE